MKAVSSRRSSGAGCTGGGDTASLPAPTPAAPTGRFARIRTSTISSEGNPALFCCSGGPPTGRSDPARAGLQVRPAEFRRIVAPAPPATAPETCSLGVILHRCLAGSSPPSAALTATQAAAAERGLRSGRVDRWREISAIYRYNPHGMSENKQGESGCNRRLRIQANKPRNREIRLR